ncbi:MAG: formylglycine-generating enzyme family protein [Magnetococcales bacterium]|nr:formylglycine-generating enzyme family protein [Magnetococcales bacterium]
MEFVKVPGGKFEMGCGPWQTDCADNEKPSHLVAVTEFWIGKYEVTQGEWRKVMGMDPPTLISKQCGDACPVTGVSWAEVHEFLRKMNKVKGEKETYRIPTEAEWEYACRSGGKSEKFCGGNDPALLGWVANNSEGVPHNVGTKAPNGLGIYDMSGNVSEWVGDWHEDGYYARSAPENPHGPSGGVYRVNRGGGWDLAPVFIRSTARSYASPDNRGNNLGFRVVRDK